MIEKEAFGELQAKDLEIGDIVEWKGWNLLGNGDVIKEKYQGVLIEVITESVGGRAVSYARILPFQNDIIVEVNIFCVYKVKQKD